MIQENTGKPIRSGSTPTRVAVAELQRDNSGGGADGSTPVLGTGGSGFDPQAPD